MAQLVIPFRPELATLKSVYFNVPPEEVFIHEGVKPEVKNILMQSFFGEEFSPPTVRSSISQQVESRAAFALQRAVKAQCDHEATSSSPSEVPLLSLLRREGVPIDAVLSGHQEVRLPQAFIEGIQTQLDLKLEFLNFLEEIRSTPKLGGAIFGLVRHSNLLSEEFERSGIDDAFNLVASSVGDSAYTLVPSDAAKLYFLTYLPFAVRYVVQDLLVNNCAIDFLNRQVGQVDEDTRLALIQHLRFSVVTGDHWQSLLSWYDASEETVHRIAELQGLHMVTLRNLFCLAQRPEGRAVLERYLNYRVDLYRQIETLDGAIGSEFFQGVDIGHCFGNRDFDIDKCLSRSRAEGTFLAPKKSGLKAVVLEDDPIQMKRYAEMLEGYSPYSVGVQCIRPDEVLEHINNKDVGYFLLDMQNELDQAAGLKIAQRLLHHFVAAVSPPNDRASLGRGVVITLWTASPLLYRSACAALQEFVARKPNKELIYFNLSGGEVRAPIKLNIHLKSECIF